MKSEDQPHAVNPFINIPRCGAYSRRTGKPCRQPAMANGRCRLHGGLSTGAPKGNQNAFKHGYYSKEAVKLRLETRQLMKDTKATIKQINGE
ncbi:MAG: HGGxSTG domain-containing protein [Desulfotignum sp.]